MSRSRGPFRTLIELLRERAGQRPNDLGFAFLSNGETESERLTYAALDRRARALGGLLQGHVACGDRVLLLLPPGLDFVAAFFGCLYAGAIAVPAYPPNFRKDSTRLRSILADAAPRVVLTTAAIALRAAEIQADEGSPIWQAIDDVDPELAPRWREPRVEGGTVALLQYTSGSTGDPKGVIVTHANLLHNESAIGRVFSVDSDSLIVGWLPLYHDMGLIGNVLQPLHAGVPCILMSPVSFLQRPRRWLEAISRYGATTSGGPNFAYDLCVQKIAAEERDGLDLRSWRVAFNGAEPVRADTLERFATAFAPCGFSPRAFSPCYGLAEATLLVAGPGARSGPRGVDCDAAALAAGWGVPPAGGGAAAVTPLVGSGPPLADQRLLIVDPEALTPCAPGRIGEIWVQGPSVARGYWNRPEESAETFAAYLAPTGEGPFLRTGDLGFLLPPEEGGELVVTGRQKDLIIVRGRNHYPQDIELTVEAADPALRRGHGAALGVEIAGRERVVVVYELEPRRRTLGAAEAEAIAAAARQAVAEGHELQLDEVVLIPAGALPMTTSGKVRRRACRDLLLAGALPVTARSTLSREPLAAPPPGTEPAARTPAADPAAGALRDRLRRQVAGRLGVEASRVRCDLPLAALGLDSLSLIELGYELEGWGEGSPSLAGLLEDATIDSLAAQLAGRAVTAPGTAFTVAERRPAPAEALSHGQRAIWFLERLAPGSGAYHITATARVAGALDVEALARAWRLLAHRHPALRTVFDAVQGEPSRRVLDALEPGIERLEEPAGPAAVRTERGERFLRASLARPFDLAEGPLVRLAVLSRGVEDHDLALSCHHIAADFASLALLVRELGPLYRQETGGPRAFMEPLATSYDDFVRWQEGWLASSAGERALAYWLEALREAPPLELVTDRPRPALQSYRGGAVHLRLDAAVSAGLQSLVRGAGATPFMALLAAFQAVLQRYGAGDDLVVGCPASGRSLAAFAPLVGYFVNPLPVRTQLADGPDFAALLGRVRRSALGAFAHQDLPFPVLVERLGLERDPSRSPVFQAMLVLHRADPGPGEALAAFALGEAGARLDLGGLPLTVLPRQPLAAQFELTLGAAVRAAGVSLCLEYNADLFDRPTAVRLVRHLANLLQQGVAAPDRAVRELTLWTESERAQALVEWNDTAAPPPSAASLGELFAAQARRTPEATALVCGEERLSYARLDRSANQLARRLLELGVGPEVKVALGLERTADLVVAVLGVWKAGGAYVPLDPAYPRERLAFMLADSGAEVLLTGERQLATFAGAPAFSGTTLCLDREREALALLPPTAPPVAPAPENLAYVIYTSGSTGRPKGVAITHGSALVMAGWARAAFSPAELSGVLASTSICFDLSVFELLAPLGSGGTVILADNALGLGRLPAAAEVTLLNTVPSVLAELLRLGGLPAGVRTVCLAGEPLPGPLVRQIWELGTVARVLNLYGPSEDTTYSTWKAAAGGAEPPTIGRPLWSTRAYVLDRGCVPVPLGVPGELLLAGAGLARGYLGRPELTAERFVPDPWGELAGEPGARLYHTGDLVRQRHDGELDYLRRMDHQVKVRGHRIELGEVEATLLGHPAVRQAVVEARRDGPAGELRLVAYVAAESADAADAAAELRRELDSFLRKALPAPMIPAVFVVLDALPLTLSGKVDRRALPAPGSGDRQPRGGAPRTPTEELLAEILADVLGVAEVGVEGDFFELGGHSLLAVRALARIERCLGVSLPLTALFQHPTVASLAERVARAAAEPRGAVLPPLTATPRGSRLPVSAAQQALWFLHQLEPESPAYHIAGALELSGSLRVELLAGSLAALLARHEALRTSFPTAAGEPVQTIAPPGGAVPLPCLDLSGLPAGKPRSAAAQAAAESAARRPFDLARGPLVRCVLLRLAPDDHRLALVFHHIVADGASVEIFLRELAQLYTAAAAGEVSPLPELQVQYADFALWQRQALSSAALAGQLGFWRRQLAALPVLELPADRPRLPGGSDRGGSHAFDLTEGLPAAEFRAACRALGVTPYMAFLGALAGLLARLSGTADVAVGSPVAGRGRIETEGVIGLFINTLVLRVSLADSPEGAELLGRVRRAVLDAHAHGEVPFERVVEELQPERRGDHSPLFKILFTYLHTAAAVDIPGLAPRFVEIETGTAKFELSLWVRDDGDGFAAKLVYRRDLFDAPTVARLAGHYRRFLQGLLRQPDAPLSRLPLLSPAERHQVSVEWNATALAVAAGESVAGESVAGRFEARAAAAPEALAVLAGPVRLSFRELNRKANRLARRLRELGVGPDVLVGVCADRSPEMIAAVLAVWKAGGAYVPLDPDYPQERLRFMLEDAGAPVLVTRPQRLGAPAGASLAVVDMAALEAPGEPAEDRNPEGRATPESLAYVLYTSGSTGRPKGVMIRQGAVVNLLAALEQVCYPASPPLRVGVNASLAFDASVKQLVQLLAGHALAVVPAAVRSEGEKLGEFLAEERLEALDCTPSQLRFVLGTALLGAAGGRGGEAPRDGALRTVLIGGEAIGEDLWRELGASDEPRFWNVYGPTECTVDATAARVAGARPVIGRPLANVQVHLLDAELAPVPAGFVGEIWIGGAGLARGYWRQPALTARRFVPNPFAAEPGERLYHSGDLGRSLPDGRLEFLGRADHQVKLRGFRIELGEIEAHLRLHPGVAQAVLTCFPDRTGEASLVAYYTTTTTAVAEAEAAVAGLPQLEEELRTHLRRSLPEPMVPAAFVRLRELPLTPSGKLDLQALPAPAATGSPRDHVAPRTATERELAGLWADLLRHERVSVRDSFFELGGHSLLAAQLISRVRQVTGVELPLRQLFETPALEDVAAAIDALRQRQAGEEEAPRPAAAIQAYPRGRRDVAELVGELQRLSPEEAARRLRDRGSLPRRPS